MSINKRMIYVITSIIVAIIYGPLLFADYVANIDQFLVEDLAKISSVGEYVSAWKNYKIADLQPVRDISLLVDRELSELFGFKTYHLTNVILWLFICYLLKVIIFQVSKLSSLNTALVFFAYISHPLFVKNVSHIGIRKHLLAFLFILLFYRSLIERRNEIKDISKRSLSFLLSLLSQPINIFIPIWLSFKRKFVDEKSFKDTLLEASPLLAASLVVGLVNIWWYFEIDQNNLGVPKYASDNLMADRVLAFGRYFSMFFIPINYSAFYGKESLLCVLGLVVGPLYFYGLYKCVETKKLLSLMILFFLSLFPVTLSLFWTFVSETYFLMGSFALLLGGLELLKKIDGKKLLTPFLGLLVLFLMFQSVRTMAFHTNYDKYFSTSYENDRNCINLTYYVRQLFNQKNVMEATKLGQDMIRRGCVWVNNENRVQFFALFAKVMVFSEGQIDSRERQLKKLGETNYYLRLHLALFYLRQKRFDEFKAIVMEGIQHKAAMKEGDLIVDEISKQCGLEKAPGCQEYLEFLENIR